MSGTSAIQHDRWTYGAIGVAAIAFYIMMSTIAVQIATGVGYEWYWGHIGLWATIPATYIIGAVIEVVVSD